VIEGENPLTIESDLRSEAEAALRDMRDSMGPACGEALMQALVALSVQTIHRTEINQDTDLTLEIYHRELLAFPGDVTLSVLKNWPGTFFPRSWEVKQKIISDRRVVKRRKIIRALEDFLSGAQEKRAAAQAARMRNRPTKEQIERNQRRFSNAPSYKPDMKAASARVVRMLERLGQDAKPDGGAFKTLGERMLERGIIDERFYDARDKSPKKSAEESKQGEKT